MARRREIATLHAAANVQRLDGTQYYRERIENETHDGAVAHSETRPENIYQALMQCAPGEEPDTPRDELLPLRDILQDAIDKLTDREQWIFDALFTRRLSLRQLGAELNLSFGHVRRLRDEITEKLQSILIENEEIRSYLR